MKKCPQCKLFLNSFYFSKGSAKDGMQSYCKTCTNKRNRKNNPINLEQKPTTNTNEVWKDIIGYENKYQVSNLGNVRSLNRIYVDSVGREVFRKGYILKLNKNKNGYVSVLLGYKGLRKYVHRLVAEAFIPNLQNKRCINHKDKIRNNNIFSNIEWVTHSENNLHSKKK